MSDPGAMGIGQQLAAMGVTGGGGEGSPIKTAIFVSSHDASPEAIRGPGAEVFTPSSGGGSMEIG